MTGPPVLEPTDTRLPPEVRSSPWARFKPGPTAQEIWRCRKQIIAIEGALGTAKSSIFSLYIANHCAENPGAVWVVVRRTYKMLKDNTLHDTWLRWFPSGIAGHLDGEENFHLDWTISGKRARGIIRFRPAERDEDIDRFMGGEYAGAVLEEVTGTQKEMGLREDIYTGLLTRLRQPGMSWACIHCQTRMHPSNIPAAHDQEWADCPTCGQTQCVRERHHMLLSFNPPSPGHWVHTTFPLPPTQTQDVAHFKIPKKENEGNLPRGYYPRLIRALGNKSDWIARYIDGERVPIGRATCIFDRDPLLKALGDDAWVSEPLMQGVLDRNRATGRIEFHSVRDGPIRVWTAPRGRDEDRYVVGADAGEGLTDGDPSCGLVGSRRNGGLVAEYHGHVTPRQFARELAMLGWWYNTAFLVPESGPSKAGGVTVSYLEDLGYSNLYQQRREKAIGDPFVKRYGLHMSPFEKSRLASLGREVVTAHQYRIPIREVILELLSFVQRPDGSMGGDESILDDRVIAWLLVLEGIEREGTWVPPTAAGSTPEWMNKLLAESRGGPASDRSWMAG